MPRLTAEQLANIGRNISHHGDMEIPMRPATLEALVADATGQFREIMDPAPMRYVDAFVLNALLDKAQANLKAEQAQPRQRFEAQDWTRLDPAFLPLGGSDPADGFHVIVKASSKRPMTPDELAQRAGPGKVPMKSGTIISVEWPVALVLATVKNADKLAARIAQLMTEDTKGV